MANYKDIKYQFPASATTSGTFADARIAASNVTQHAATYDDDKLQSNVALLGFKTAVNGSLAKYNLQDQIIDEYTDATGVDASASTGESLAEGSYSGATGSYPSGGTLDTSMAGYRIHKFTSGGSLTVGSSGNVDILVVGGGGAGGYYYGGGGGAGGLIYKATHGLTANTYDAVIGAGGAVKTSDTGGSGGAGGANGADTTWTINGGSTEFTAKGGGGGADEGGGPTDGHGQDGGSGGGASYVNSTGWQGVKNQTSQSGDSGTYGFGGDGDYGWNNAPTWNEYFPGGGGGAGGNAPRPDTNNAGNGGAGKDYSSIFGTSHGDSGWFASGGGGGFGAGTTSTKYGVASSGGGANGSNNEDVGAPSATANTGGGGGGGGNSAVSNRKYSGAGGSGVILVRYATSQFLTIGDLVLQSTDTTASTEASTADMVMLMENSVGTATLNTDIKGYISRDSGTTFTQGTLVDEGTWGTNKKILAFHDLDISGQPSGTDMCYKITTHNQSGSKKTNIHATSMGWK